MINQPAICFPVIVILLFSNFVADMPIGESGVPTAAGLWYAETNAPVPQTFETIVASLEGNAQVGVVAQIDHAANARKAGSSLRDSRILLFGNPKLGTPLMQENQLAGLDLPQKIAVYQSDTGKNYVVYNSADYLAARYGLTAQTLPQIAAALEKITMKASGNLVQQSEAGLPGLHEGIVTLESSRGYKETLDALEKAINSNPRIRIMAQLDHQANARKAGMDLNPAFLLVLGNPAVGTPLMQSVQSVVIDLPQKMLVWEDGDRTVFVSYNEPAYLAQRHHIPDSVPALRKMEVALHELAMVATGN